MNKIMKKLCCGVVLGCGLFSFSGCTSSQMLSESQIEDLLRIANNADDFMDKSLDLLEGKDEVLDVDEAYNLVVKTFISFDVNVDGIRNNAMVEVEEADVTTMFYYYKNSNGEYNYIVTEIDKQNNESVVMGYYEKINGNEKKVYEIRPYSKPSVIDVSSKYPCVDAYFANGYYNSEVFYIIGKDAIKSTQLLDNGNYLISFYFINVEFNNDYASTNNNGMYELEISKDAKIVRNRVVTTTISERESDSYDYSELRANEKFSYGTVTDEKIAALIASIENK